MPASGSESPTTAHDFLTSFHDILRWYYLWEAKNDPLHEIGLTPYSEYYEHMEPKVLTCVGFE